MEHSTSPRSVAIEQLESLDLSVYAARTYVTVLSLDGGTAREVSANSEVPRTRVYDAAEELHDHGFVNTRHTSPRRFEPARPETVERELLREYTRRVETLREALDALGESTDR